MQVLGKSIPPLMRRAHILNYFQVLCPCSDKLLLVGKGGWPQRSQKGFLQPGFQELFNADTDKQLLRNSSLLSMTRARCHFINHLRMLTLVIL